MQLSRVVTGLMVGMASVLAGCSETKTSQAGPDQQGPSAQSEIDRLNAELNRAMADRQRDQNQVQALQNELARLRKQLAERPETASPAPGWDTVPGGAMTSIEGTILFDSGKAVLKPSGRQTLDAVARVISEKFPEYDVYVFGHTDDEPIRKSGWKDNYELSAQRALSVVRSLRGMSVENKMAAAGWGEQLPIEASRTASARQRNRRVEIYAMAPEKGRHGRAEASPPSGAGRGEETALEPSAESSKSRATPRRTSPSAGSARPKAGHAP